MTQNPASGGEGANLGASGILGVNNLQRAIDSFDRTVAGLQTVVSRMSQISAGWQAGSQVAGSWNKFSNWAGASNGGNPTFRGTPFNPNSGGQPSSPTASPGGSHRATGPASYRTTSPSGGGSQHRGGGNGYGKAAFAISAASTVISGINAATTQPRESANTDSLTYLTVNNAMSLGGRLDPRKQFTNGWSYQNGTDQAAATMANWQTSGSSGVFNQMRNWTSGQILASPMMSGSQAQSAIASSYSVSGMSMLHRVGITTIDKGGSRRSPLDIANQVLAQIDPTQSIRSEADAQSLLNDPFSYLNLTLSNWVGNGIINGDQVQAIKDNIQMILKARANKVGFRQLQSLVNTAKPGNASSKTLASMQIGNSAKAMTQTVDASKRTRSIDQLDGFEKGLDQTSQSLSKFNDALNAVLNSTGANAVAGYAHGALVYGKTGALLGAGTSLANTGFGASATGLGTSGVGASEIHALTGGIGGSTESRMSVTAAGGSGSTSARSAGSGATGSATSRGFIFPVNPHPVTEAYGVKGAWAAGYHTGVDFGVPTGTPVKAAASGTVVNSGPGGDYGNYIVIDHHNGLWSLYAHNSRLLARVGASVRQGQLISYSGETGRAFGPHLHFEIRKGANRYGADVNPMGYLGGSMTISSAGGGGNSGPSTGVGSSTSLGTGASYSGGGGGGGGSTSTTTTSGGGSSVSAFGAGMSELDVLGAGGSAGGGGSSMVSTTTTTSGGGGGGGGTYLGSAGGSNNGTSGGTSGGATGNSLLDQMVNNTVYVPAGGADQWRQTVVLAMKKLGLNASPKEVDRVLMQMRSESGGNPKIVNKTDSNWKAGHPSVGLMQVIQGTFNEYAGPYKKTGPFEYGVSTNPLANIYAALNYAVHRYGSIDNAFHGHGYDKGAWSIPSDELAKVHKDEMIVPAAPARQIREILMNGNPYGAMGNRAGSGSVILQFNEGSIKITTGGTGSGNQSPRAIGKQIVDAIATDDRIKNLQKGVVP